MQNIPSPLTGYSCSRRHSITSRQTSQCHGHGHHASSYIHLSITLPFDTLELWVTTTSCFTYPSVMVAFIYQRAIRRKWLPLWLLCCESYNGLWIMMMRVVVIVTCQEHEHMAPGLACYVSALDPEQTTGLAWTWDCGRRVWQKMSQANKLQSSLCNAVASACVQCSVVDKGLPRAVTLTWTCVQCSQLLWSKCLDVLDCCMIGMWLYCPRGSVHLPGLPPARLLLFPQCQSYLCGLRDCTVTILHIQRLTPPRGLFLSYNYSTPPPLPPPPQHLLLLLSTPSSSSRRL